MHVYCIINVQKTRQNNNMLLKQWHVSALLKSLSFQKQLLLSSWCDRVFQVLRFSHDPNTLPKINIEPENWWFPSSESPVFQGRTPPQFSGFMFLFLGAQESRVVFLRYWCLTIPLEHLEAPWIFNFQLLPPEVQTNLAMECRPACLGPLFFGSWNMKNDGWYEWYVIIRSCVFSIYIHINIYIWKLYGIVLNMFLRLLKVDKYGENARWWCITMNDGARVFMVSPSSWKIIFHCPRP